MELLEMPQGVELKLEFKLDQVSAFNVDENQLDRYNMLKLYFYCPPGDMYADPFETGPPFTQMRPAVKLVADILAALSQKMQLIERVDFFFSATVNWFDISSSLFNVCQAVINSIRSRSSFPCLQTMVVRIAVAGPAYVGDVERYLFALTDALESRGGLHTFIPVVAYRVDGNVDEPKSLRLVQNLVPRLVNKKVVRRQLALGLYIVNPLQQTAALNRAVAAIATTAATESEPSSLTPTVMLLGTGQAYSSSMQWIKDNPAPPEAVSASPAAMTVIVNFYSFYTPTTDFCSLPWPLPRCTGLDLRAAPPSIFRALTLTAVTTTGLQELAVQIGAQPNSDQDDFWPSVIRFLRDCGADLRKFSLQHMTPPPDGAVAIEFLETLDQHCPLLTVLHASLHCKDSCCRPLVEWVAGKPALLGRVIDLQLGHTCLLQSPEFRDHAAQLRRFSVGVNKLQCAAPLDFHVVQTYLESSIPQRQLLSLNLKVVCATASAAWTALALALSKTPIQSLTLHLAVPEHHRADADQFMAARVCTFLSALTAPQLRHLKLHPLHGKLDLETIPMLSESVLDAVMQSAVAKQLVRPSVVLGFRGSLFDRWQLLLKQNELCQRVKKYAGPAIESIHTLHLCFVRLRNQADQLDLKNLPRHRFEQDISLCFSGLALLPFIKICKYLYKQRFFW